MGIHTDLYTSSFTVKAATALHHTSFLSIPHVPSFRHICAKVKNCIEWTHGVGVDIQRTQLFNEGQQRILAHTQRYGVAEVFGIGAFLGGAILVKAQFPEQHPKSDKL